MSDENWIRIRLVEHDNMEYEQVKKLRKYNTWKSSGVIRRHPESRGMPRSRYICTFLGDDLVGLLVLSIKKQTAWIEQLLTDEVVMNQEADQQMIYFAEQVAQMERCEEIRVQVYKSNLPHYGRLGYAPLDRESCLVADCWVMVKDLRMKSFDQDLY